MCLPATKKTLPYRDKHWTCQWLWVEKQRLLSENIGEMMKTFPNHSPVVQHPAVFLICQQSAVQSQRTFPGDCTPSPISAAKSRKRDSIGNVCIQQGCNYSLHAQPHFCAYLVSVLSLRVCVFVWWGEGQCMTVDTVYYSSLISASSVLLCTAAAAGPESRYRSLLTSLIEVCMQITAPVYSYATRSGRSSL